MLPCSAFADASAQIASLEKRIAALEQRVAELEKNQLAAAPAPSPEEARAARRAMFNKRMAQDRKIYSDAQLREAEQLYQVANKDWSTPQARESLQTMIDKYADVNRTGCAVLYLGQMSEGKDREKYLMQAIEKHGDCMYGDGVIVGAYARLYLAQHYAAIGEKEKAKKLFSEILKQFPDAIDHNQAPLAPQVEVYLRDL
jgi:hypothetical protein